MAKKRRPNTEGEEQDQGADDINDDDPVTVGDIKRLLKGLPNAVQDQVYRFLGVNIDPEETREEKEKKLEEALGGYKTIVGAVSDLRKRLGEAERKLEGQDSSEDILSKLKRYIDEEIVPTLRQKPAEGGAYDGSDLRQQLEGDQGLIERVRKLEEGSAYGGGKKGRREDPKTGEELRAIREVLIDVVKEVYGTDSTGQRYLKLLEDRRKA